MTEESRLYLAKAAECLAGAESEFAARRFDNVGNRAYYACFQAAIAALLAAGVQPRDRWGHEFVQAEFVRRVIRQSKGYPADLANTLVRVMAVRFTADYDPSPISDAQARRVLQRARVFVRTIQDRLGGL